MKKSFLSLVILGASLAAAPALAQGPVALEGSVQVERKVVENGQTKTVLAAPEKVVPGDRLIFKTAYRNTSSAPIQKFVVTNPVPAAVMVAADSAATLDVSVDGAKTWGKLAALKVANADGTMRPATNADITHVRWTLPVIAAGENGALAYNAIVR